jgi:EAL domain
LVAIRLAEVPEIRPKEPHSPHARPVRALDQMAAGVTVDFRNAAVVRAAIHLANELGLELIAEGVETEAQVRFLCRSGLRAGAGLLFQPAGHRAPRDGLLRAGRVELATGPLRSGGILGRLACNQTSDLRSASRCRRSRLVGRGPPVGPARADVFGAFGVRSS